VIARPRPISYGSASQAWAELLRRTFQIDVLACPECGGRLRLLATIEDPRWLGKFSLTWGSRLSAQNLHPRGRRQRRRDRSISPAIEVRPSGMEFEQRGGQSLDLARGLASAPGEPPLSRAE